MSLAISRFFASFHPLFRLPVHHRYSSPSFSLWSLIPQSTPTFRFIICNILKARTAFSYFIRFQYSTKEKEQQMDD